MLKNRVFVDSSILIAALLSSRGGSFYILTQLKDELHFQINNYVLGEIFKVLDKKFYLRKELKNYLFLLFGFAKVEILSNPSQILVKKLSKIINKEDAPILASALSSSDYLLTLDNDFLNETIRNFAKGNNVLIFNPKEFISFLPIK